MDKELNKPLAWQYLDYRKYLRAFYDHKKRSTKGRFSYRIFSNKTKVASPNYLKLIIDGDRNLTLPHARRVAKFCELDAKETQYFLSLVKWNQAEKEAGEDHHWAEVLKQRSIATRLDLSTAQLAILSDLKTITLFELLQIESDSPLDRLAKRLGPGTTIAEVAHALELLQKAELIQKTAKGFKILNRTLKSSDDVPSQSVRQFHRQAMSAADEALGRVEFTEREFISTTVAIPKRALPALKEKIRAFRDEILSAAEQAETPEEVFQLNVQFFPLTKPVKDPQ